MKTLLLLAISMSLSIPSAFAAISTPYNLAAETLAGMNPLVPTKGVSTDWQANAPGSRLNSQQRQTIRQFSSKNLTDAYNNTQTVFYPFGGPDVIFPSLFFPSMKTLILVGQENPGTLPQNPSAQKISEIRNAYLSVFTYGYYITSNMSRNLREFGTTTMISVGLVLMGNTILDISPTEVTGRSVKVTYQTPQGDVRQVYYFQQNLADKSVSPGFVAFVQKLKVDTTFYKASSYVPQLPGFTKVKNLALGARYFVQSDTGLRIDDFLQAGNWDVHLFGQYVTPKRTLSGMQIPLAYAYANSICRVKSATATIAFERIWRNDPCQWQQIPEGNISIYDGMLPFNYDYAGKLSPAGIRDVSSNLIYAVKK